MLLFILNVAVGVLRFLTLNGDVHDSLTTEFCFKHFPQIEKHTHIHTYTYIHMHTMSMQQIGKSNVTKFNFDNIKSTAYTMWAHTSIENDDDDDAAAAIRNEKSFK